jgi:hypothetical protein
MLLSKVWISHKKGMVHVQSGLKRNDHTDETLKSPYRFLTMNENGELIGCLIGV